MEKKGRQRGGTWMKERKFEQFATITNTIYIVFPV